MFEDFIKCYATYKDDSDYSKMYIKTIKEDKRNNKKMLALFIIAFVLILLSFFYFVSIKKERSQYV